MSASIDAADVKYTYAGSASSRATSSRVVAK